MIKEEELRQLVNRLGMQMGLKLSDSYRKMLPEEMLFPGKMEAVQVIIQAGIWRQSL